MDNGSTPATKQDLSDLKAELLAADARLKGELLEAMRDIETHLLNAFYGYTQSVQKHLDDLDRTDISVRERLSTLETRVMDLERRINFPGFNP